MRRIALLVGLALASGAFAQAPFSRTSPRRKVAIRRPVPDLGRNPALAPWRARIRANRVVLIHPRRNVSVAKPAPRVLPKRIVGAHPILLKRHL